uniref:Endoplasmic reticulum junction formation protein lunapark n=1 Tax=Panagrolaimus sp. JU765 TaxID=591449 RepID=A0AC34QTE5_9BILA
MGSIFSKKVEPKDELERIAENLKNIDKTIDSLQEEQRNVSKIFMLSLLVVIAGVAIDYCYKRPQSSTAIVIGLSLAAYIVLCIGIRIVLLRLYSYRTDKQYIMKEGLNKRKNTIMEEIKQNEKFNVARELILKYGNEEDIRAVDNINKSPPKQSASAAENFQTPIRPKNSSLMATPASALPLIDPKLKFSQTVTENAIKTPLPNGNTTINTPANPLRTPLMRPKSVRPYVGAARTPVDKLVDFVIGEGPNNRYALICKNCEMHNGMALPAEFEHLSYYCYNCNFYNQSQAKQKSKPTSQPRGISADAGSRSTSNSIKRSPSLEEKNEETEKEEYDDDGDNCIQLKKFMISKFLSRVIASGYGKKAVIDT